MITISLFPDGGTLPFLIDCLGLTALQRSESRRYKEIITQTVEVDAHGWLDSLPSRSGLGLGLGLGSQFRWALVASARTRGTVARSARRAAVRQTCRCALARPVEVGPSRFKTSVGLGSSHAWLGLRAVLRASRGKNEVFECRQFCVHLINVRLNFQNPGITRRKNQA